MSTTTQNKTLHNKIRKLAPDAIETMGEMLRDPKTPGPTKAQLIGFILERTLGKPDTTIHLMTEGGTVKDAENRLIAIAEEIRDETANDADDFEESGDDSDNDVAGEDGEYDDEDEEETDPDLSAAVLAQNQISSGNGSGVYPPDYGLHGNRGA